MTDLTARQRQVLRAILALQLRNGSPPTLRLLADAVGLRTTTAVMIHLQGLARKGYLTLCHAKTGVMRLVGVDWMPVFDSETPQGMLLAELYREVTGKDQTAYVVPGERLR